MTKIIRWKKKSTNINSSFDSIVYVLLHATKMQLFWWQLKANDVLPCVPIFDYLKCNNYFYFEKNLRRSIQMFGWYYIMTCGPM
jgi:hypothetical protein